MDDLKYIFLATIVIFAIEFLTGGLKGVRLRDLGVTLLCYAGNSAVTRPLAGLLIGATFTTLLPHYAGALSATPFWLAFLGNFLLMEFCFYWMHRWAHEGQRGGALRGPLWKVHRTHHSANHLNVSVTMRQNLAWAFVAPTPWIVGLSAYLGMGAAAALSVIVIYVWNLLTHTNFRWDAALIRSRAFGPAFRAFQLVIVTPSMHHSHHGYGRDGKMYCNYAVMLATYDWLFGSLYLPSGAPSRYGVPGETPHWAEEVFFPIVRIERPSTAEATEI